MPLFAQAANGLGSSTGILGIILGGALLTALVGAYRFAVNFRTTERGLNRQRIREANRGERRAQQEASLWQGRCADLEYLLRTHGITPPPLSEELRRFIDEEPPALPAVQWDDPMSDKRPGTNESTQ